jgi:hypothetical protein
MATTAAGCAVTTARAAASALAALRRQRHLDWGERESLAQLASEIAAVHGRVGGELVPIGVSYSG